MAAFNPYSGNQQDYLPWMSGVEKGIRGGHQWGVPQMQQLVPSFGGVSQAAPVAGQIDAWRNEVGSQQDIGNNWWSQFSGGNNATPGSLGWNDLAPGVQQHVRTANPDSYGWNMDTGSEYFSSPRYGADNPGGLSDLQGTMGGDPYAGMDIGGLTSQFEQAIMENPYNFVAGNNLMIDGVRFGGLPDAARLQQLVGQAWANDPRNPAYGATQSAIDPGLLDLQNLLAPNGGSIDSATGQPTSGNTAAQPGVSGITGNTAATGARPENANVYDFQAPENPLMPQVQQGQQQIMDMLMNGGQLPYVESLMAAQRDEQQRARQDQEQSLTMRGIGNSTIADESRNRQDRQQQAAQSQTAMQGLQTVLPAYQNAYGNIFNQGQQGRQQSVNEFLSFLDRQTGMDQWDKSYKNQTLSLMLNALGVGTVNPQMPQGGIPNPPAGAAESLGGIIGNVAPALPWDKWL